MLMLLTLRDLGMDHNLLSSHYSGIADFKQFMKHPGGSGDNGEAKAE